MKISRSLPTECLLNNIIDEDFQSVLFPLSLFQTFFLLSTVKISNNFVTPEVKTHLYIKCVVGSSILVLCYFVRFYYYIDSLRDFGNEVVIFFMYFDLFYYSLVGIMLHIVSGIQRNSIVELIITLQSVLKLIHVNKRSFLSKHKIQNWINVVSFASFYVVFALGTNFDTGFLNVLLKFVMTLSLTFLDIPILSVTCTIIFINDLLSEWILSIQTYNKGDTKAEGDMEDAEWSGRTTRIFEAYANIVKSFKLCNEVYRFAFAFFALQTFLHILITLKTIIELSKLSLEPNFYQSVLMRILSTAWNLKNFFLLTSLSIACENFYRTARVAEGSCVQILHDDQDDDMRRSWKNVVRLNRAALRKLSAFGVFELDAAFPLRLLGGLVSYTVVLLQFAFL